MNERDIELAGQATTIEYGGNRGFDRVHFDKEKFADLIRADEREALIRYFDGHWRSYWSDGQIIEALEARGNK